MRNSILIFSLFLSVIITGCGGGSEGNSGSIGSSSINIQPTTVALSKSISVSWDIPTKREDNITLLPANEISGYNIYISTNNTFIPSIPITTVTDSSVSDYTIYNLSAGTYYLYVTTIDTNGDESTHSAPITKII